MKATIPLIQIGRMPREHLPAGHPDLHVRRLRQMACDLDCTLEEAREVLLQIIAEEYGEKS